MPTSEILAIAALVGCTAAPVILVIACVLAYVMFRDQQRAKSEKSRLQDRIRTISNTSYNIHRHEWLAEIQKNEYASELEVEAKFVYPLLRHLGWEPDALRMRVPTTIRVGREDVKAIADWVVYLYGKPVMVIEVKNKYEAVAIDAQRQARSYCYGLNVTKYMLTNGREIQVFERGLDSDILLFETSIEDLPANWRKLYEVAGCCA
jgi:hypothetical protein